MFRRIARYFRRSPVWQWRRMMTEASSWNGTMWTRMQRLQYSIPKIRLLLIQWLIHTDWWMQRLLWKARLIHMQMHILWRRQWKSSTEKSEHIMFRMMMKVWREVWIRFPARISDLKKARNITLLSLLSTRQRRGQTAALSPRTERMFPASWMIRRKWYSDITTISPRRREPRRQRRWVSLQSRLQSLTRPVSRWPLVRIMWLAIRFTAWMTTANTRSSRRLLRRSIRILIWRSQRHTATRQGHILTILLQRKLFTATMYSLRLRQALRITSGWVFPRLRRSLRNWNGARYQGRQSMRFTERRQALQVRRSPRIIRIQTRMQISLITSGSWSRPSQIRRLWLTPTGKWQPEKSTAIR